MTVPDREAFFAAVAIARAGLTHAREISSAGKTGHVKEIDAKLRLLVHVSLAVEVGADVRRLGLEDPWDVFARCDCRGFTPPMRPEPEIEEPLAALSPIARGSFAAHSDPDAHRGISE